MKFKSQFMNEKFSKLNEEMFKGESYYDRLFSDKDMAYELELFLENDGQLYRQQFMPIIENLKKKIKSGRYDHSKAPKLWVNYVENGLKKYAKELGSMAWNQYLTPKDRMILATKLADYEYDRIMDGEYN